MATENRGEQFLDSRIIPADFDWQTWDTDEESNKVLPASTFMEDVIESYYAPEEEKGEYYPWEKAQKVGMRFRPGEVTLYGGHSGSYKSMVQGQIALHLMAQGSPCMIASFEMRPKKTLGRMVRQAASSETPAIAYMRQFKDWTNDKLWLYDHYGNVDHRKVFAVVRYSAKVLGCKHMFLDSLMKMLHKTDDYNEQKEFMAKLCSLASSLGIHIHLVAHARKKQDGNERITKFDVHGAGELEKQADNVLMIQRNLKKRDGEVRVARQGNQDQGGLGLELEDPDVWIAVEKQREGAFEGSFGFGFDKVSLCVVNNPGDRKRGLVLHDSGQ